MNSKEIEKKLHNCEEFSVENDNFVNVIMIGEAFQKRMTLEVLKNTTYSVTIYNGDKFKKGLKEIESISISENGIKPTLINFFDLGEISSDFKSECEEKCLELFQKIRYINLIIIFPAVDRFQNMLEAIENLTKFFGKERLLYAIVITRNETFSSSINNHTLNQIYQYLDYSQDLRNNNSLKVLVCGYAISSDFENGENYLNALKKVYNSRKHFIHLLYESKKRKLFFHETLFYKKEMKSVKNRKGVHKKYKNHFGKGNTALIEWQRDMESSKKKSEIINTPENSFLILFFFFFFEVKNFFFSILYYWFVYCCCCCNFFFLCCGFCKKKKDLKKAMNKNL